MLKTFEILRDCLEVFGWAITGGALGFLAVILGSKLVERVSRRKNVVITKNDDYFKVVSYNPLVSIIVSSIVVASVSLGLTIESICVSQRAWICTIVSLAVCLFFTLWTYWFISQNNKLNNDNDEATAESGTLSNRLPLIAENSREGTE